MSEELKFIKKKYGEDMMHYCRDTFSIILENEGKLSSILLSSFDTNHDLFNDIKNSNKLLEFKSFIYSLFDIERKKVYNTDKTPKELFDSIGYDFYEVNTEEEIQSFKKYYAPGEALCTFNGGRLNSCHVFWVVKKDVDSIKREDFKNPLRQDEYGTSVMSIQFTRDEVCMLSIKNRYNHRVNNPDATFSNNLDNIIPGLTESFANTYGLFYSNKSSDLEIPNYVQASDGKFYKYNFEWNNVYYCPGNIVIDNFKVKKYEKEKYILMDNMLLDLSNKKLFCYDIYDYDGLASYLDNISDISIISNKESKSVTIKQVNGEESFVTLDKNNNIIGFRNDSIKQIGNNFLCRGSCLSSISLDNVLCIGRYFLSNNKELKEISLPNVVDIDQWFLSSNQILDSLYVPKLRKIGHFFLYRNTKLNELDFPNVEYIDSQFMFNNNKISYISIPKLEYLNSFKCNQLVFDYYMNNKKSKFK